MMDFSQQFGGEFIDAAMLMVRGNPEVTVTIAEVHAPGVFKDATKKPIDEPVLSFNESPRKLILGSKINRVALALLFGTETDEWIGKKVTLTVRILPHAFGETNVPCIRVKIDRERITFGMRKHMGLEWKP